MHLKAVIVEDEQTARDVLQGYLNKYCDNVEVSSLCSSVEEGLAAIKKDKPDLVFLDVEMPYGNAFDLLDKVENRDFETVFVTAYDQYAKDALNAHAAYYLLKPIEIDELVNAVEYVREVKIKELALKEQPQTITTKNSADKITLPTLNGFEVVELKNVLYCQADNNYTQFFFENGNTLLLSKTLKHFEQQLQPMDFIRLSKSHLVNMAHVKQYRKGKGGSVLLSNNSQIMVAPSRKKALFAYFG